MKRDQFTAELSTKLRERGVDFDPAALAAFTAYVQREPGQVEGAQSFLDRFIEARRDYATAMRKAFFAAHAVGFGILLMLIGTLFITFVAYIGLSMFIQQVWPDNLLITLGGVLLLVGIGVGTAGAVRTFTAVRTLLRSRRAAEEAFARRPALWKQTHV